MKENHTVICFLRHEGKILILRRSSKVRYYHGKWNGVSGYIEEGENPDQTAVKEVQEETGLEGKILAIGEVVEIPDEAIGIKWMTHPYLFEVDTEEIKMDWEHTEFKWVIPEEITNYDCVPKLKEALEKVWKRK